MKDDGNKPESLTDNPLMFPFCKLSSGSLICRFPSLRIFCFEIVLKNMKIKGKDRLQKYFPELSSLIIARMCVHTCVFHVSVCACVSPVCRASMCTLCACMCCMRVCYGYVCMHSTLQQACVYALCVAVCMYACVCMCTNYCVSVYLLCACAYMHVHMCIVHCVAVCMCMCVCTVVCVCMCVHWCCVHVCMCAVLLCPRACVWALCCCGRVHVHTCVRCVAVCTCMHVCTRMWPGRAWPLTPRPLPHSGLSSAATSCGPCTAWSRSS